MPMDSNLANASAPHFADHAQTVMAMAERIETERGLVGALEFHAWCVPLAEVLSKCGGDHVHALLSVQKCWLVNHFSAEEAKIRVRCFRTQVLAINEAIIEGLARSHAQKRSNSIRLAGFVIALIGAFQAGKWAVGATLLAGTILLGHSLFLEAALLWGFGARRLYRSKYLWWKRERARRLDLSINFGRQYADILRKSAADYRLRRRENPGT